MLEMASGTWTVLCKGSTHSVLLLMTHAMTQVCSQGTLSHTDTQPQPAVCDAGDQGSDAVGTKQPSTNGVTCEV